jgi:hypothetical protein
VPGVAVDHAGGWGWNSSLKKREEELQVVAARSALEMVWEVVSVVPKNSKGMRLPLGLSLLQEEKRGGGAEGWLLLE